MSTTAFAAMPSRVRVEASSTARDDVRFQINTSSSEGLTARWAATSHGAIWPAPTTSRVLGRRCKKLGAKGGIGGRAPISDLGAVDDCEWPAISTIEHDADGLYRG